jgi:Arc/MetJ-type ribon-helix-helix transcriptional regulator
MGRPPMNVKPTMVRLTHETRERIKALVGDNRMSEFIREAVDREIKRRERATEAKKSKR